MAKRANRAAWGLVVALLVLLSRTAAYGAGSEGAVPPFPDVPPGHPAAAVINDMLGLGILCGYPISDALAVRRSVTRYEFAFAAQHLTDQPFRLDFVRFRPGLRQRVELPP